MLVVEGLVGLHRTIQLQPLQCYWLGHRLGLLWYWTGCLGNEQRSFCHFWDCIQVLYFGLFVDHDGYSISSRGFLPTVVDIMVIYFQEKSKSTPGSPLGWNGFSHVCSNVWGFHAMFTQMSWSRGPLERREYTLTGCVSSMILLYPSSPKVSIELRGLDQSQHLLKCICFVP